MQPQTDDPLRVVVVGGGVGAWELAFALRKLAPEHTDTAVITPGIEFHYVPSSVAAPFKAGEVFRFPLAPMAEAAHVQLVGGTVNAVDTAGYEVHTADGGSLHYDALVIATGARRLPVLRGAIPFRGEVDIPAIEAVLEELDRRSVRRIAFALPGRATWSLPLYELALLTAGHVSAHAIGGVELTLVTPEEQPLAVFGGEASAAVTDLLARRHVILITGSYPTGVYGGVLMLVPEQTIAVDRVICMPEARGIKIAGLPHDYDGFLPTDLLGRVDGPPDVFAVGDITNQPLKQGGIAAQQADVVAALIARHAGADVPEPEPHRPTLRALLLTGDEPQYLESHPTGGHGGAITAGEPPWWPGGKIAAQYLGPYLAHAEHVTN